jgi:3-hydroxy-9,10-secoandrosta-1,3,5(10)-triene-9,17-dione monooxygenase
LARQGTAVGLEELRESVTALGGELRAAVVESERLRRLPEEIIKKLREAGFFRLMKPKRFGGDECGFDALVELALELGRHCGSSGWMAVALNTGWLLGTFPEAAQQRVWGEGVDTLTATSFFPTLSVDMLPDGYRIGGKWAFCSGIHHSDFVIVGGLVATGEALDYRLFLLARSDYEIEDDWDTIGLRGTGSASVLADGVFVAREHTLSLADLREGCTPGAMVNPAPLYSIPFGMVFPINLAAPVVGIAMGALEQWTTWTKERRLQGIKRAAEYVPLQLRVAEAAAEIDCAQLLIRRDIREAMELACSDAAPTASMRARAWRDGAYAAHLCTRAVGRLFEAAGGSAVYQGNPVQRAFRDIHTASAHVSLRWDEAAERFGRDTLGLPPNNPFFY